MKQLAKQSPKNSQWSFEEDSFLTDLVQSKGGEIEWQIISKIINQKFHQSHTVRKSKQAYRRWEKVVSRVLKTPWNRSEAQKFVVLAEKYAHTSRRFWNKLKLEFESYTFKMLNHKFRQLSSMTPAQFIMIHKCSAIQRKNDQNDCLNNLCESLSKIEEKKVQHCQYQNNQMIISIQRLESIQNLYHFIIMFKWYYIPIQQIKIKLLILSQNFKSHQILSEALLNRISKFKHQKRLKQSIKDINLEVNLRKCKTQKNSQKINQFSIQIQ